MKIRSITYFINPGWPLNQAALRQAGEFISAARAAYEKAGYEVQTARLATVPFPHLIPSADATEVVSFAQSLEKAAQALGYGYVSIGPALPENLQSYRILPKILEQTQNVFVAGLMTTEDGTGRTVSLNAVRYCAEVVRRAATILPNGFANLRFAALANGLPGAPFFPAAYHLGNAPTFALATEAADLAVEAFSAAVTLDESRRRLTEALESHGRTLTLVGDGLARAFGLPFAGIDFSLAPFPTQAKSLGAAMEKLGVPALGLHGTLAAAAILTDTIDGARFPHAGFSGLMLPVLEDAVLAVRAAEGTLTVMDLLLYSAVCGTGLDTVPLPGDITFGELQAILLDVAALALRLDKPLTARLMPIPGKAAGDPTEFDFDYFANSRVMAVRAQPLTGMLAGGKNIPLSRRTSRTG